MTGNEPQKRNESTPIELRPDGWDRFEQAVDAAIKSGPKHRAPTKRADKPQ